MTPLVFAPATGQGATLVGVVSERSAPEMAAAAQVFFDRHPGHELILRTPRQLDQLKAPEVAALLRRGDAVLISGIFRDDADRLLEVLDRYPISEVQTLLALHGDHRLTRRSRRAGRVLFEDVPEEVFEAITFQVASDRDPFPEIERLGLVHPEQRPWLNARRFYLARGPDAWSELFAFVLQPHASELEPQPIEVRAAIRFMSGDDVVELEALNEGPTVAVVDYDSGDRAGDRAIHASLLRALHREGLRGISVLTRWGQSTVEALQRLKKVPNLVGVVVLQDFVLGGGSGRDEALAHLRALDVPVMKGLRLVGRSEAAWRASDDGLPWESVHYQVAMPELQGAGQPLVVATAGPERSDPRTGLRLGVLEPIEDEVQAVARRLSRWHRLRTTPNADKRVAVVYYNHPPGRHNIGADNLDVPASLMQVLETLDEAGYDVKGRPPTQEALLEELQERGVNLPEDRGALEALHQKVAHLDRSAYQSYFDALPDAARAELASGPIARLVADVERARAFDEGDEELPVELFEQRIERTIEDTRHLLEGADHPARDRALDLLDQFEVALTRRLTTDDVEAMKQLESLGQALVRTGVEGLRGWGPPPGQVMVHDEDLLVPGLQYGNVFVGPQPPRGWELNEELLHANLAFPPPHQYLAFYEWIRSVHRADVVVHLGRHSTYEFLPGRRLGLAQSDFPRLVIEDLPSVYIYVVDGVGEGIQAKRRGLATIVDHLTPSMQATPLYDDLLELRQLVESFEAAEAGGVEVARSRAVAGMKEKIEKLNLRGELETSMAPELEARGIGFSDVDDDLLVHEIGHYLTHLQERFMPHGLHVFGRAWSEEAVDRMLDSMMPKGEASKAERLAARRALVRSPKEERAALLAALSGRFVQPGKGNDPIRTPEALPTGRNFHALDGSLLPTRVAWTLGNELAAKARQERPGRPDGSEAVVLWASDTVRDEGAMVAFGLALLGLKPEWNARGILVGLELEAATAERPRRDTTFVTSGLFRDLYDNLMVWLDRAGLLALSASAKQIRKLHPELGPALDAALSRLPVLENGPPTGDEPLEINQVAAHWVRETMADQNKGTPLNVAGRRASLRLFGNAPGGYGAGINRLAERSGAWSDRSELAQAYTRRMGHAYGDGIRGEVAHDAFSNRLATVEHSYLGRASNLYGLLDNNDGFDYLGGLGLAVEAARGKPPAARVIRHADPNNPQMQALGPALLSELRGRHLNPTYLEGLMEHGYAGARTLSQGFVENLWGWQVTSPHIVKSWAWDEVHDVLIEDRHDLGIDDFFEKDRNVHVLTNIEAILLVAASRDHWQAEPEIVEALAKAFAEQVLVHGLPGSGHTRPDHPVMTYVGERLDPETRRRFEAVLEAARVDRAGPESDPASVAEVERTSTSSGASTWLFGGILGLGLAAVGLGLLRGRRG
ncbi:MAG: cobaltochelatase subunit CobN [Myxococcota bacterium]